MSLIRPTGASLLLGRVVEMKLCRSKPPSSQRIRSLVKVTQVIGVKDRVVEQLFSYMVLLQGSASTPKTIHPSALDSAQYAFRMPNRRHQESWANYSRPYIEVNQGRSVLS